MDVFAASHFALSTTTNHIPIVLLGNNTTGTLFGRFLVFVVTLGDI
jgi:hypothetical protein